MRGQEYLPVPHYKNNMIMVQNSNVAPFKMCFLGSLVGAWAQLANETVADTDPFRNGAQIAYNQLNSSLSARRQWKYYQKQAELDHQYNLQTMDHAAEIARDQYDYEYQMESPAARVLQLQQAGLNKALMYGSGAPAMQGSVSSGAPVSTRGNMPNFKESFNKPSAAAIGSALSALSQNKVNEASAAANRALADKYSAEASDTRVETLERRKNLIIQDLKIERYKIENAKTDDEREYLKESYNKKLKQLDLVNQQIEQETKTEEAKRRDLDASANLKDEQAKTEESRRRDLDSSANLKDEQAKTQTQIRSELISRAKLNESQSRQLDELARKYEIDNEYREEVNRLFEKYGVRVDATGPAGLLERVSLLGARSIMAFLKELGIVKGKI